MARRRKNLLENPEELIDKKTQANLDNVIKNYLKKKHDFTILIVGDKTGVGMGKSVLSHILCAYIDKKLKRFRYTPNHIFFDGSDFKLTENELQEMDSFSFDEPDAFLSTEAMTREVRSMKIKFAHIRQRRHFICICSPNPMLLTSWFRPGGQSRANILIRIVRRGVFYVYSAKTGTMDGINIIRSKHKIRWPRCDYIGFFKKIPEDSDFWKAYTKNKNDFLRHKEDNPKALELMRKAKKKENKSLLVREICDIHGVTGPTVHNWIKLGMFGKRGVFFGVDNKKRVTLKAYNRGIKRIMKIKNNPNKTITGAKKGRPKKKR